MGKLAFFPSINENFHALITVPSKGILNISKQKLFYGETFAYGLKESPERTDNDR